MCGCALGPMMKVNTTRHHSQTKTLKALLNQIQNYTCFTQNLTFSLVHELNKVYMSELDLLYT